MDYENKPFRSFFDIIDHVPSPEGYPNRDTSISHEDITDLIITLNTTKDVNHFLAVI